jgi:hypothetical protein
MGYIGFQTSKTGNAIQIQSVDTSKGVIYVENIGTGAVYFQDPCVYINGVYVSTGNTTPALCNAGNTQALTLSGFTFASGQTYTIKVSTTGGTFNQITINT